MSRKRKKMGPTVPWEEYLDSIRYRYPYVLPPPVVKQRQYDDFGVDPTCVAYKGPNRGGGE